MTIMYGTIATGGLVITAIGYLPIIMNGWTITTNTSTEAAEQTCELGQGRARNRFVSVTFFTEAN